MSNRVAEALLDRDEKIKKLEGEFAALVLAVQRSVTPEGFAQILDLYGEMVSERLAQERKWKRGRGGYRHGKRQHFQKS